MFKQNYINFLTGRNRQMKLYYPKAPTSAGVGVSQVYKRMKSVTLW